MGACGTPWCSGLRPWHERVSLREAAPIRAIIFDFDGTIIDTEGPDFRSWEEVYRAHGCTLSRSRWGSLIGTAAGAHDPYAELARLTGRDIDRGVVRALRHRRLAELVDAEPLRPGIAEYIELAAAAGIRLAIASNASRAWVEHHLSRRGLRAAFGAVLSVEDVDRPKPQPDLYLAAAHRLRIRPVDAVAVEDSPHGVLAAKRAGMFCVAAPHELTMDLALDAADVVVASLAGLPFEELRTRWQSQLQGRSVAGARKRAVDSGSSPETRGAPPAR